MLLDFRESPERHNNRSSTTVATFLHTFYKYFLSSLSIWIMGGEKVTKTRKFNKIRESATETIILKRELKIQIISIRNTLGII